MLSAISPNVLAWRSAGNSIPSAENLFLKNTKYIQMSDFRQPAFCQTDVSGSVSSNYLIEAANIIKNDTPRPTYYTPKNVVDLINKDCIIINPAYNVEK